MNLNTKGATWAGDGLVVKQRRIFLYLLMILLFSFVIRIPFFNEPLERDEGGYTALAQAILRGEVIYKDVVDHKPPLIYFIYSIIFRLFGQTDFAVRLFTALYSVGTITAVFFLARNLFGNKAALFASLLYGIFSSAPHVNGTIGQSENFFVLPIVLGVFFFVKAIRLDDRRWLILSGTMMGLAVFIKTTAAPTMLLFPLLLAIKENPFKRLKNFTLNISYFSIGPLVLVFLILGYFAYNSALTDFIHWNIIYNSGNIKPLSAAWPRLTGRGMHISSGHLLLWLLAVISIMSLARKNRDMILLMLILWLVTSFLGISMTGNFWKHYFLQILPPLSVLAGYGILIVYKKEHFHWPMIGITGLLTLLFAWSLYKPILNDYKYYIIYSPEEISRNRYETNMFNDAKKVGEYIRARTKPTDFFFQWGWEPQLYFYTMRRHASKHLYYHTVSREPNDTDGIENMVYSILAKRTKYIVIQRGREGWSGYEQVAEIVNSYYIFETEIGGMMIFRLEGT